MPPAFRNAVLVAAPVWAIGLTGWAVLDSRPAEGRATIIVADATTSEAKRTVSPDARTLHASCGHAARQLADSLAGDCHVWVNQPYVLAGDVSAEDLAAIYHSIVQPTAAALTVTYKLKSPEEPILIVLLSSGRRFRQYARKVDEREIDGYSGYYLRSERKLAVDLSAGSGVLAHELTHALVHCDFPQAPAWFDEGLAALHEHCELTTDGNQLIGRTNWRLHYLLEAIDADRLRPLESMLDDGKIRPGLEAIDYAQARMFCQFLQQRGRLSDFYAKWKSNIANDPTGRDVLAGLFPRESLPAVDRAFRHWALHRARTLTNRATEPAAIRFSARPYPAGGGAVR